MLCYGSHANFDIAPMHGRGFYRYPEPVPCIYKGILFPACREEGEKLNVWVALMNLENLYGNQESLLKVFEQALQQNEPIEVFFRLTSVYETSNKLDVSTSWIVA